MTTFPELIARARARAAGACSPLIDEIEALGSIEAARQHPRAPEWACWYAQYVIEGRWTEGEAVIATDPEWARWYARYVYPGYAT